MQVCTSLQTEDHASTPSLKFLQSGCPSCRLTNSVKALIKYRLKSGNRSSGLIFCSSTVNMVVHCRRHISRNQHLKRNCLRHKNRSGQKCNNTRSCLFIIVLLHYLLPLMNGCLQHFCLLIAFFPFKLSMY